MSLKRIFLQHRSPTHTSESSKDLHRHFPADDHQNESIDNTTNEQCISIEPFQNDSVVYSSEEQSSHRTRRRSSVPILDKKFIQTLSNQFDNEPNIPANVPEDVCECG